MTFHPWMLLSVGTAMFFIGLVGVMVRRNLLVVLMCIELMLNASNICFVAFSRLHQNISGDLVAVFVMTVAAAESAVGLGLIIALYRTLKTVESEKLQLLRD